MVGHRIKRKRVLNFGGSINYPIRDGVKSEILRKNMIEANKTSLRACFLMGTNWSSESYSTKFPDPVQAHSLNRVKCTEINHKNWPISRLLSPISWDWRQMCRIFSNLYGQKVSINWMQII